MPFPLCPLWTWTILLDPHLGFACCWGTHWGPEALGWAGRLGPSTGWPACLGVSPPGLERSGCRLGG